MTFGVEGSFFDDYAERVRQVYAAADTPDIATGSWQVGALQAQKRAAYPAVAFTRPGGQLEATKWKGPIAYVTDAGSELWFSARYDDVATVHALILANSWRELDCVWSGVVSAARDAIGVDCVPGGYRQLTEEEEQGLPVRVAGLQHLVQTFTWRMPLPHVWGTKTEVASVTTTPQMFPAAGGESFTAGPPTTQP